MKNNIFILVFLLLFCCKLFAQWPEEKTINPQNSPSVEEKEKKFNTSKLIYGGSFGLTFGSITAIELSPIIGYKITPKFHTGIGLYYSYFNNTYYKHDYHSYGASVFARYYPIGPFLLHAELQGINEDVYKANIRAREWIAYPLAGVGIAKPLGSSSRVILLLLWNFNDRTGVRNPIIQVGFSF